MARKRKLLINRKSNGKKLPTTIGKKFQQPEKAKEITKEIEEKGELNVNVDTSKK